MKNFLLFLFLFLLSFSMIRIFYFDSDILTLDFFVQTLSNFDFEFNNVIDTYNNASKWVSALGNASFDFQDIIGLIQILFLPIQLVLTFFVDLVEMLFSVLGVIFTLCSLEPSAVFRVDASDDEVVAKVEELFGFASPEESK